MALYPSAALASSPCLDSRRETLIPSRAGSQESEKARIKREETSLKVRFENHPVDLYFCLLVSASIAVLIHLGVTGPARIALGLPFVLFVPGYVFIFALFPEKPRRHSGIEAIERIALSLGMSIAIVPLIGLALNYTPWGIRLQPILVSLLIFVGGSALVGLYRWRKLEPERRHVIEFEVGWSSLGESRLDRALSIALGLSIVVAVGALIWAITTPKIGERFTEFYILGPGGMADEYPTNLTVNQTGMVILGIQNHEYENLTYFVEVWVVNQTWNEETNTTVYFWGILLDRFNVSLPSRPIKIDEQWTPQWEKNYTFSIPVAGRNKLAFLLYKGQPPPLVAERGRRYDSQAMGYRMENAYREVHLWVNVTKPGL